MQTVYLAFFSTLHQTVLRTQEEINLLVHAGEADKDSDYTVVIVPFTDSIVQLIVQRFTMVYRNIPV